MLRNHSTYSTYSTSSPTESNSKFPNSSKEFVIDESERDGRDILLELLTDAFSFSQR